MKIATSHTVHAGAQISVLATTTDISNTSHPENFVSHLVFKRGESDLYLEILEEIVPQSIQPRHMLYTDAAGNVVPAEMDITSYVVLRSLLRLALGADGRVTFILRSEDSELRQVGYYSPTLDAHTIDSAEVARLVGDMERRMCEAAQAA